MNVTKKKYGRIVHRHHISYKPEEVVKVFAGEHKILTLMHQYSRKTVSRGFLTALRVFIALNQERAVEL